MKRIKRFFEELANARVNRYCSCGHAVSANLPVCPYCGRSLGDTPHYPAD